MRDKISESRVQLLHPLIRNEVKQLIEKAESIISPSLSIRIVQGLRTIEEQNALHAIGRTKPGKIVTNAVGGLSYHNYGLAIDFAFITPDKEISWDIQKDWDGDHISDWKETVNVFKSAGYEWGGDWTSIKDYPHFQKTFGYNVRTLLGRYTAKNFIQGTKYVNL